MILQATNPASQEMVIFHMMSVRTEMRPTNKSAAAKCLMKKFIRDLRPFVLTLLFLLFFTFQITGFRLQVKIRDRNFKFCRLSQKTTIRLTVNVRKLYKI